MLLQIPVLIALFAVLRFPSGFNRIPEGSDLRTAIESQHTDFLGANLLCSPSQAGGGPVKLPPGQMTPLDRPLDCGTGFPVRIPYYVLLAAMIGSTFYQSWQMQRASPTANPQQQLMGRIMPVFFGFIGFTFPAGLILYWTTTNLVQIGQQHFMLPKRPVGAEAAKPQATGDGARKAMRPRGSSGEPRRRQPGTGDRAAGRRARSGERRVPSEGGSGERAENGEKGSPGERHGRSRKKRRKR